MSVAVLFVLTLVIVLGLAVARKRMRGIAG
jgi:hypothetical protein